MSEHPGADTVSGERRLTILVVDDNEANLLLLERFLSKQGHQPVLARNGAQAVDICATQPLDMVLMDIMMPVMDGIEATEHIRELTADRWLPVIMISARSQDGDQAEGLAAGADDYLTKPINFTILAAKIKVMQRIAAIQRQLARYREEAEEEQLMANTLMKRLIRLDGLRDQQLRHWISPARRFSGDLVAATRSINDDLYVVLADATGHGLPAALNLLPITQIFYGMAEKGYRVPHLAAELNRRLREIMPTDRFVAATLVCISNREQTVELWNGGTPPPVIIDLEGEQHHLFASRHLPLGILPADDFDGRTEIHHWQRPSQLLLCSDGLLEAEDGRGVPFGMDRLMEVLRVTPHRQRFISVAAAIQEHLGSTLAHDDLSLVMVECPVDRHASPGSMDTEQHPSQTGMQIMGPWHTRFVLNAQQLRQADLVPLVINVLSGFGVSQAHCERLFLIVSELYNNALDHGILGLDSAMKRDATGFEEYVSTRARRLESLDHGHIDLAIEHLDFEGHAMLRIHMLDSGPGFDHRRVLEQASMENNEQAWGRGIILVRSLASDLRYLGSGNEVIVDYTL